jgi:hypothetical protein
MQSEIRFLLDVFKRKFIYKNAQALKWEVKNLLDITILLDINMT